MEKLVRMAIFGGWNKEQIKDFCLSLVLTAVTLTGTIIIMSLLVP